MSFLYLALLPLIEIVNTTKPVVTVTHKHSHKECETILFLSNHNSVQYVLYFYIFLYFLHVAGRKQKEIHLFRILHTI